MIKLLQNLNNLSVPPGSVGTKIAADLFAYGTGYPFLTAWQQLDPQNRATALLCKKEDSWLLCTGSAADFSKKTKKTDFAEGTDLTEKADLAEGANLAEGADFTELTAFVQAVGGRHLQLQGPGNLTALKSPVLFAEYCLQPAGRPAAPAAVQQNNLKGCYQILYSSPNSSIAKVGYNGWYADLSHKIRHGYAFCATLNGAAAVVSHLFGGSAVLSGVAVLPQLRGKGRGRQLLAALPALLPGVRRFYVCCAPQTEPFYKACGFVKTGQAVTVGRL